MPTISRFYGIRIQMHFEDHPPPHFHADYNEFELVVGIAPAIIQQGKAPRRVRSMVLQWARLHQQELLDNWERCRLGQLPLSVEPLE